MPNLTESQRAMLAEFCGGKLVDKCYPSTGDMLVPSWEFPDGTYFRTELWNPSKRPAHVMRVLEALAEQGYLPDISWRKSRKRGQVKVVIGIYQWVETRWLVGAVEADTLGSAVCDAVLEVMEQKKGGE